MLGIFSTKVYTIRISFKRLALNIFKETKIIDDTEFKQALIHGKMLINKTDGKETHKIFLENKICRFGGNTIRLTIAPTMACNFRCPYCYEKGKEYTTMNAEIIDKLKEYIQKLKKEYKYIYIMWYGMVWYGMVWWRTPFSI